MAQRYPDHAKAVHINFFPVMPPFPWRNPLLFLQSLLTIPFSTKDKAHLASSKQYLLEGSGYYREQETCPQTLGYALHDSPVALLAWIYEKLHAWTDNYSWTDDEILTWVSIYQFSTAGPAASVRIYYEAGRKDSPHPASPGLTAADVVSSPAPHGVQFAVAQFRRELFRVPLSWRWLVGNVVRAKEYDCGGHFAAWEVPELLASDVKAFLGRNSQAYGTVSGKSGF